MTNKLLTIGVVIALALSAIGFVGKSGSVIEQKVAGLSSPDISSPYFSFGDIRQWASRDTDLTQASTTICALQSPAATSTLLLGSIKLSVSSTSDSILTLAKAATAYATTTSLGTSAVGANAQITVLASTTPTAGQATVFGPNQWFVVGMQGGAGTFSPTGVCEAVWIEN